MHISHSSWLSALIATSLALSAGAVHAQSMADLRAFLQEDAGAPSDPLNRDVTYRAAQVTLHGATPTFVVYFTGSAICGSGGCSLEIYVWNGHTFEKLARTTVTRLPIRALDSQTNGWHDIGVFVQGLGLPGYEARLRFNGMKYPSNPSLQPRSHHAPGKTVLSEATPAIPLFPAPR
jgi:hypothetical protein